VPALGNFTDEQDQRRNSASQAQDTRDDIRSNEFQRNKNKPIGAGGFAGGLGEGLASAAGDSGGNSKYKNGPQCKWPKSMINTIAFFNAYVCLSPRTLTNYLDYQYLISRRRPRFLTVPLSRRVKGYTRFVNIRYT